MLTHGYSRSNASLTRSQADRRRDKELAACLLSRTMKFACRNFSQDKRIGWHARDSHRFQEATWQIITPLHDDRIPLLVMRLDETHDLPINLQCGGSKEEPFSRGGDLPGCACPSTSGPAAKPVRARSSRPVSAGQRVVVSGERCTDTVGAHCLGHCDGRRA
jgi:hypothetical protein